MPPAIQAFRTGSDREGHACMKRSCFTEEQIMGILKKYNAGLQGL